MKTINTLLVILSIFILLSCDSSKVKIDSETYTSYLKKGDEITNLAQGTLLGNVSKAIQKGGTAYAVTFCNLKASSIVDSLNQVNDCVISRVSDKNRNPENFLKNQQEKEIWESLREKQKLDTLVKVQESIVYYKTIKTALPACLKCHGNPESEIPGETLGKLSKLYPNDLATGYGLNDFRGMWKVEFEMN